MLRQNERFRCYIRGITSLACGMFSVKMAEAYTQLGYKVFLPIGILLLIITNVVIGLLAKR